ncbi:OLC1v1027323C1 [Oldenlandia corymbosa var. corymbosa]|uniref:non-specific serine/threonine protein kinase n=1 Tax=Oldenlandia corymbosa var. corymbosa TaxID=529605 RepID=A0AAV1CAD2_OLDCO|nr:OLC1v1027323C1 [Oldenlandia corymbosa var. corymbosa]
MDLISNSENDDDEAISEVSPCGRFVRSDEVLGRGAFKVVYKGFDLELGFEVAWCQINMNREIDSVKSRLLSEVHLMEAVQHENVVKCYSWWIDQPKMNINTITELCNSGTLRQYRKKHKSVNLKAIKNWGSQILKGLNYLHTHDPPVVHRDLKCDNIFVNGNNGQVKIGDLGMATLMEQHRRLGSVLGTPEFMAPELYDEDYNELVDVYSFGMCMLELVTCEYPYSECNNVAQIFKKVTTGVKPLALGKVKDPQIKSLIEKCLLPASHRPSAAELLKDPFFSSSGDDAKSAVSTPKSDGVSRNDKFSFGTSSASLGSVNSFTPVTISEASRFTDNLILQLRGKKLDNMTISFKMRIADTRSHVANCFEFDFDLKADDALKIALELADGKDLTYYQVPVAVELIDNVLLQLEPSWIPCHQFVNQPYVSFGCREMSSTLLFGTVVH